MSIFRRGRAWWADFYIQGIRVRRSLDTTIRKEAVLRERELYSKLSADVSALPSPSLEEIKEEYLKWAAVQHPRWAKMEGIILGRALKFFADLGITLASEVTSHHIDQFKVHLRSLPPPLSPASVNRYVQTIRAMYYRTIDWGRFEGQNPVAKTKMYREERDLRPLSAEDYGKVIETARAISAKPESPFQKIFYDLVVLCANTGLRRSEALNLKWRNVDTDAIMIRGKGNRTRMIPLNAAALEAIGRQPRTSEYVLDIPNREQSRAVTRTYARVGKALGRQFRLHDLRHKFATDLMSRGVDIKTVAELLGHSASMVTILYAHSSPEKKRNAVDLLDSRSQKRSQSV